MTIQGVSPDSESEVGTIPASIILTLLDDQVLEKVVRHALESRIKLGRSVHYALDRALDDHVKVAGFRNASAAPAPVILKQVCDRVRLSPQVGEPVLKAWYEAQPELCHAVESLLAERGLPLRSDASRTESLEEVSQQSQVHGALVACAERLPSYQQAEVGLMLQLLTGKMVVEDSGELELDTEHEGGERNLEEQDFELLSGDSQIGQLLCSTLSTLGDLPFSSTEWEKVVPAFATSLSSLIESKQAQRAMVSTLDNFLESIKLDYVDLLTFFQCDSEPWSVNNIIPTYSHVESHLRAEKLRVLLDRYVQVHDRAPVVSDEMTRAARRAELIPQVMDATRLLQRIFGVIDESDDDSLTGSNDSEPVCSGEVALAGESVLPTQEWEGAELTGAFISIPPCYIEDHLLLRLTCEDLEQENEELEHQNAGLRGQVKALEHQLYERRNQEESLRWAVAYRDNPEEPEEYPDLQSVGAAVELAIARYPGQLLFQLNADSDAEESAFKWPEQVWKALQWLATDYFASHLGDAPIPDIDEACRRACGMWYKTSQHETTMTQYRDSYTTRVDGRLIWLGEHIGKGNSFDPRRTIRIAFDWDRQLQKVVIGYIGQHQRSAAT